MRSLTSLIALVCLGVLVLVFLHSPVRGEDVVVLSGRVDGDAPEGKFPVAFHFFDKGNRALVHRVAGELVVHSDSYAVALQPGPLSSGGEFYVMATSPEVEVESYQGQPAEAWGLVRLQPTTPGIPQTGHVNVTGTLIAGAIKTNAFQMATGASAGRVLTSDASGNGMWQALPPPSGAAGGDLLGSYPNPSVDGLQGRAVASTAPTTGQALKWDGSAWSPGVDLRDAFWQATGLDIFYTAGEVGIGVSLPAYRLHVETSTGSRAIYGVHNATTGTNYGGRFESDSVSGLGVFGWATATTGTTYGVAGQSASTSGIGVSGSATATSGTTYGGRFESDSSSGRGIYAVATATGGTTYGVYGATPSTSGRAVYGFASATTGINYGGRFESDSTSGRAVLGWASAGTGTPYGVWGQCDSVAGVGLFGWATAVTGTTYGVYGRNDSTSGRAVHGVSTATSGTTFGVYGASASPSGFGVYSVGDFAATGTKSFQIDHPLWPETHYLNHFCTEAPEPLNAYSGNVVTDARGYATVQLPDYFDLINRDFRYQLTVIDDSEDFVLAKVVRKIQNNQFVIRTNKPNVEVSWEVKGIRNDPYVQRYGFETEQEKEDEIRGRYLHPELFGMPKEYGIHYSPDLEEMKRPGVRDLKPSPNNKGAKTTKSPKSR